MCGIFGSFKFNEYEKLYNVNKKRGTFAYGSLYVTNTTNPGIAKDLYVRKREGVTTLSGDYAFEHDYDMFLGHTQAPTSAARKYSPVTSHPFDSIDYMVAHNGVLENTTELLKDIHMEDMHDNPVDSSIIPILLTYTVEFDENEVFVDHETKTIEVQAIEHVCSKMKGTFSCWIHSKITGDTYLVRSGSTLYGNMYTGSFSSTWANGIANAELKEGVVYCVTSEGLAECGSFETNSPFFL